MKGRRFNIFWVKVWHIYILQDMDRPFGMLKTKFVEATDIGLTELGHSQAKEHGEKIITTGNTY